MQTTEQAQARGLALGAQLTDDASVRRWHDVARRLAAAIGWPKEKLIDEVTAFDHERLEAVPDLSRYPELRGYRDLWAAHDRGVLDAGADPVLLAISRSMEFYRATRLYESTGIAYYAEAMPEKCRVLYVPDSPDGPIHAKNVDDPAIYFTPRPPEPAGTPWPWSHPLLLDGVGSGLHIDEVPPEIFPVDTRALCLQHCTTVAQAEELMVRYNFFWSSQNLLIHDHHGNSVAFEKTTCRVATRAPDSRGINFITGMGALDPEIRAHHRRMRQKYLDQIDADWDGPDGRFWTLCQGKWDNMAKYVRELPQRPTLQDVNTLMEKRDPTGPMCLTGVPHHPDCEIVGWTLVMQVWRLALRQQIRRQYRDGQPAYLDPPELIQYA